MTDDHPGNTGEPSARERVSAGLEGIRSALATAAPYVKRLLSFTIPTAIAAAILYVSWNLAGPLATILYTVLFLVGAVGIPTLIGLFAPSFPRSFKNIFGKLNFVLGQLAFGRGVLVQHENRYEMCPATEDRVYIDGEWHDLEGDQNWTVLGWQPFGILRYKDANTLQGARVDDDVHSSTEQDVLNDLGLNQTRADGGSTVNRAGYQEVSKDRHDGLSDGTWLVDLKRVFSRGLRKIGDIESIEKAEEVAMRKEAEGSRMGGYEPIVGSFVGLLLGVMTGYVMLGGM